MDFSGYFSGSLDTQPTHSTVLDPPEKVTLDYRPSEWQLQNVNLGRVRIYSAVGILFFISSGMKLLLSAGVPTTHFLKRDSFMISILVTAFH